MFSFSQTICRNTTSSPAAALRRQRRSVSPQSLAAVWKRFRYSLAKPNTQRDAFDPNLQQSKEWLRAQLPQQKSPQSTLAWLNSLNARVVVEHTEDVASGGRKSHVNREIANLLWEGRDSGGGKAPAANALQRLHGLLQRLARLRKEEKAEVARRWPGLVSHLQRLQKPEEAAGHLQKVLHALSQHCTTQQVRKPVRGPAGKTTLAVS